MRFRVSPEKESSENGTVTVFATLGGDGGMTANNMKLAMKKFQQVDSTLNRSHEASGLGLSLATRFAGLHGGTLKMESRVGEATMVHVRLPQERPRDAHSNFSSAAS